MTSLTACLSCAQKLPEYIAAHLPVHEHLPPTPLLVSYATQIHCVDPNLPETIRVFTELPMMLTCLAVLPTPPKPASTPARSTRQPSKNPRPAEALPTDHETTKRKHAAAVVSFETATNADGGRNAYEHRHHCFDLVDDVVVAAGGVGGVIHLIGIKVRDSARVSFFRWLFLYSICISSPRT